MQGIEGGFRIRTDRFIPLQPAKTNMQSAGEHPAVIEDHMYLTKEVRLGCLLPLPSSTCVHISLFRVIPKAHMPGKWRMITNLSSPHGASLNNAIDPNLCSLEYRTPWYGGCGRWARANPGQGQYLVGLQDCACSTSTLCRAGRCLPVGWQALRQPHGPLRLAFSTKDIQCPG